MTRLAIVVSLALCSAGCKSVGPNPEDVPSEQDLVPDAVPVLLVTLLATDAGYQIIDTSRRLGALTLTIVQNRDVLITAYDDEERVVESVSVSNPREANTAGTDKPETLILEKSTVTVRFAAPDEIYSLGIIVRRGPNAGYEARLPIKR